MKETIVLRNNDVARVAMNGETLWTKRYDSNDGPSNQCGSEFVPEDIANIDIFKFITSGTLDLIVTAGNNGDDLKFGINNIRITPFCSCKIYL